MLDNLGPYKKVRFSLHLINIYQLFFNRMGINKKMSSLLCLYSGINKFFQINKLIHLSYENKSNYNNNYLLNKIQYFFTLNKKNLDTFIKKDMLEHINKLVDIKNIIGKRHELRLPVRGQRNRTNGSTQKRMHRIINKDNKKSQESEKKNKNKTKTKNKNKKNK
jgi:ribosomal protein S13